MLYVCLYLSIYMSLWVTMVISLVGSHNLISKFLLLKTSYLYSSILVLNSKYQKNKNSSFDCFLRSSVINHKEREIYSFKSCVLFQFRYHCFLI